jgi:hypothetical protein
VVAGAAEAGGTLDLHRDKTQALPTKNANARKKAVAHLGSADLTLYAKTKM